jgi:uncharacterized protein YhfF
MSVSRDIPARRVEFGWPGDDGVGEMLIQQIIDGVKTATCSFKRDYTREELDDVYAGAGELYAAGACGQPPRCVIHVTDVFETPFGDPDPRLVAGEGDGEDVAKFQADHRVAWAAEHGDAQLGDDEPLVVELFEFVREI